MTNLYFKDSTLPLRSPVVMGILNVTPDSFSDGGQFTQLDSALYHAEAMLNHGAKIIDIGGESTRPGAEEVTLDHELERVIPVIEALKQRFDCHISIDTSKQQVMQQAVSAGADMINDVRALQEEGAVEAVARLGVPVCLMHMQGKPRTMQNAPEYRDVVDDIVAFFNTRVEQCLNAGIAKDKILLDPGFGFGKTLEHNFELLAKLDEFKKLQMPLLIGLSRKSMIGAIVDNLTGDNSVNNRMIGSVSGAVIAAIKGARIIRVHDVKQTVEALAIVNATLNGVKCD